MLSVLSGLALGVVAGAAVSEVVRAQKPELMAKANAILASGIASAKSTVESAKSAFTKGYRERDTNEPDEKDE